MDEKRPEGAFYPDIKGSEIYTMLAEIMDIGQHRRTGTEDETKSLEFLDKKLRSFGLAPQVEEFPIDYFHLKEWGVKTVWGESINSLPLWYSGSTGPQGIEASVVFQNEKGEISPKGSTLQGNILLREVEFARGIRPVKIREIYDDVAASGATAFLAARKGGSLNAIIGVNSEAYNGEMRLPALVVGDTDGARLIEMVKAAKEGIRVKVLLDAEIEKKTAHNIYALIPGQEDALIALNTSYNCWFKGATERAGIAGSLAIARLFAMKKQQHRKSLLFTFTSGHEVGMIGIQAFLKTHEHDLVPKLATFINMGSGIASKRVEFDQSRLKETGEAEDRGAYISDHPVLNEIVSSAIAWTRMKAKLEIVERGGGEARYLGQYGVPTVAIIGGAGHYWHTPLDTLDKTSPELLEQAVSTYLKIMLELDRAPDEAISHVTMSR